jgi:hypothetical protein
MIHFYCYVTLKKIIVSDLPAVKVKAKYGYRYELLNSIKEKDAVEFIKTRLLRSYHGYEFIELFHKERKPFTEEAKRKMSLAKLGKPRDETTRQKISRGLKGRSNFQGKKHTYETKEVMAEKKIGNDHAKDLYWAHDPKGTKETRVKDRNRLPQGFALGRDYYSTEAGIYGIKSKNV